VQSATTPILVPVATSAEPAPALPDSLRADLTRLGDHDVATCVAVATPQGSLLALPLTPRQSNGAVERVAARRARLLEQNLDVVAEVLAAQAATEPGLDPVRAIRDAVRLHPTPTTMVVITSGVSTADPVDLRRLGWDCDLAATASEVASAGWLPDLRGWRVRFAGLGEVAPDLPELPPPLRQRLVALWLAVSRASGASSVTSDDQSLPVLPSRSTNVVPEVPLPRIVTPVPATVGSDSASTTWQLPASLLFGINSAVLAPGPDDALRPLVHAAQQVGGTVCVTGHTDALTGTRAFNDAFSLARAESVALRLRALGLNRRQITTIAGVGSRDASADPGRVSADRKVTVTVTGTGTTPPG
jgi:outer membrane protein OmpA-like peptidoglycan-associated protein